MKKKVVITLCLLIILCNFLSAEEGITGFWKSISDETGKTQTITAIYEYNGQLFGRIIVTFDEEGYPKDTIDTPAERTTALLGNPFYAGLDFIWNLTEKGNKWTRGKILDPQQGRLYSCEMWLEDENLIVRGQILFFGRNQTWCRVNPSDLPPGFHLPDYSRFRPSIPSIK